MGAYWLGVAVGVLPAACFLVTIGRHSAVVLAGVAWRCAWVAL